MRILLSLHHSRAEECWECDCHEPPEWSDWEVFLTPALPHFLQNVQGGGWATALMPKVVSAAWKAGKAMKRWFPCYAWVPQLVAQIPKCLRATFRSDGLILRAGRKLLAKQHIENTGWMGHFAFIHLKNTHTEMKLFLMTQGLGRPFFVWIFKFHFNKIFTF